MPDQFDDYEPQTTGAERRVQEKQDRETLALKQENAVLKAGLTDLNPDQRAALVALLDDDPTEDTVKAKALSLGFVQPETNDDEPDPAATQAVETGERISAVATDSAPPVPPQAIAASWRDRLTNAPVGAMQIGGPLYQQVLAEIAAQPNLRIASVDHDGTFVPTS